jgi:hypothetical protein
MSNIPRKQIVARIEYAKLGTEHEVYSKYRVRMHMSLDCIPEMIEPRRGPIFQLNGVIIYKIW